MNWHQELQQIIAKIDKGTLTGSKVALRRVRNSRVAAPLGKNGLGDEVFSLGRLPNEQGEKYLYLRPFSRPTATGATARAYVTYAP